jgi:membrane-bound lytic murein transglycosylase D
MANKNFGVAFWVHLLLAFNLAHADTNVLGDVITPLEASGRLDNAINPTFNILPNTQGDAVLNYLPDAPATTVPPSIDKDASDLRDRIISGYQMPDIDSEYTSTHEAWYAARPDYVKRMMDRSQRYLYHIVVEVEKRGMPSEIALLPMVESAFNPKATSRTKASGIWQFMPKTGKTFGLKQNNWVDDRKDITAATNAALDYLQKLHTMFGTWDLALAAYNAGEGTVQHAIDRNLKQGLPTDYQSLPLPSETKNYVPKLQAIKNIMANPQNYGLNIDTIPNRPYFTTITLTKQIDAKLAAQLADISFEEFTSLNPEFNHPIIRDKATNINEILLPISAAETFKSNLQSYDKPLVSWQDYHAQREDRMDKIAKKFGVNSKDLRDTGDSAPVNKNSTHPKTKSKSSLSKKPDTKTNTSKNKPASTQKVPASAKHTIENKQHKK